MADNNNSLSSILAENWTFSPAAPKASALTSNASIRADQAAKQAQLNATTDPTQRAILKEEIDKINASLLVTRTDSSDAGNNSLFDGTAKLDYARFPTYIAWEDNKKTGDKINRSFQTNVPGMNKTMPIRQDAVQGEDGLSVKHLVQWSEAYPALRLRYQDFAYCKNVGLPNNRMAVLRRFRNGVPDNLFDYFRASDLQEYGYPVSTMITWIKPTVDFITLAFNENWKRSAGDIASALNIQSSGGKSESLLNVGSFNLADSSLLFSLLAGINGNQSEDLVGNFMNEPGGNPRLVRTAAIRGVGGADENSGGIYSSIQFKLEFEFEMRDIRNIDPGVAMLDLIGNCFRMGTEVSQFRLDYSLLKNDMITKILNGDYDVHLSSLLEKLGTLTKGMSDKLSDAMRGIYDLVSTEKDGIRTANSINAYTDKMKDYVESTNIDDANSIITGASKHIISRYRENIKHALASETGLPSGRYHVTIGNPKQPIISCGDLIIDSSRLTLGKDLAFNDFPKTFKYEIDLSSARTRGRNELERIFNAGRGRIYVYNKPSDNPDYQLGKSNQF